MHTQYTHTHTYIHVYMCVCVWMNGFNTFEHLILITCISSAWLNSQKTWRLGQPWPFRQTERRSYINYIWYDMIWHDMIWYDMIWLYSNCRSFCQSVSVMIASIFFPTTWPGSRLDKKLCHALDPSQCVIVCAEWQLGFQRNWADLPLEASHHLRKLQLVLIRSWMSDVRNAISSLRTW